MNTSSDLAKLIRPRPRTRPLLLLFVVVEISAIVGAGLLGWSARQEAERSEELAAPLQRRAARPIRPPSRVDQELNKKWDALAQERGFPWHQVLRSLEHALDPEIELTEFLPDPKHRTMVLNGVARSRPAILRYLNLLAQDQALFQPFLVSETPANAASVNVITFEIRVSVRQ